LKKSNPELLIEINGGLSNIDASLKALNDFDGVMIGRSAYKRPLRWSEIDKKIYGINTTPKSASDIIFSLVPYIEDHLSNGGKSWDICKHLINLVEGIPKAKIWRNQISNKSIKKELNIEYLLKLTTALKEMGF
jgi:tRNA-dihydrouridine synthase A